MRVLFVLSCLVLARFLDSSLRKRLTALILSQDGTFRYFYCRILTGRSLSLSLSMQEKYITHPPRSHRPYPRHIMPHVYL